MSTYYVHAEHYWTYKVDADSPEDAEQIVIDGDGGHGECTGYSTASVTAADDEFGEDLRSPLFCRGCGKTMPPSSNGECTQCLLARLGAERARLVGTDTDIPKDAPKETSE